jgi:hypothetical protein
MPAAPINIKSTFSGSSRGILIQPAEIVLSTPNVYLNVFPVSKHTIIITSKSEIKCKN